MLCVQVYEHVDGLGRDELIEHVLRALKGASVKKLTSRNVSVGVVGRASPAFTILEGDAVRGFVGRVTNEDDEDESEEEEKRKRERRDADEHDERKQSDMQEEQEAKRAEEEQRKEEQQTQPMTE